MQRWRPLIFVQLTNLLTVRQVAERLTVSNNVVYREIARRRLRCYHIGGSIRISDAHLQEYLDDSETGAKSAPREFKHVRKIGG